MSDPSNGPHERERLAGQLQRAQVLAASETARREVESRAARDREERLNSQLQASDAALAAAKQELLRTNSVIKKEKLWKICMTSELEALSKMVFTMTSSSGPTDVDRLREEYASEYRSLGAKLHKMLEDSVVQPQVCLSHYTRRLGFSCMFINQILLEFSTRVYIFFFVFSSSNYDPTEQQSCTNGGRAHTSCRHRCIQLHGATLEG